MSRKEKTQKDLLIELIAAVKEKQPDSLKPETYKPDININRAARSGVNWSKDEDIAFMEELSSAVEQMALKHKRSSLAIWYRIGKIVNENRVPSGN